MDEYEVVFADEKDPIKWGTFASLEEAVANVMDRVKVPAGGPRYVVRKVKDWTVRREIKAEKVVRTYD